ncbi:MAG: (p)ppGpp synthase/HD superfamily hydrolase [Candidatus Paceibacteria bacterium]|jgi:(p)ppGpp synthase/HD superfamily hydrolase
MDTIKKTRRTLGEIREIIENNKYISDILCLVRNEFGFLSISYLRIVLACLLSRITHARKLRKDGDLLITHERAIFVIAIEYLHIYDVNILIAIFMHDMVEDYLFWKSWMVYVIFGKEVRDLVFAVTKPDKSLYSNTDEHDRAMFDLVSEGGPKAMILKTIDRFHNMLTLHGNYKKRNRKVRQTIKYVLPLSAECDTLVYELEDAVNIQLLILREVKSLSR